MAHLAVTKLNINGREHALALRPERTLLDVLRTDLGLTGAKEACGMGNCGSCTVLMDGAPVYACLLLAVDCDDRAITTIEGLAQGRSLHPVQQAFIEADALQCGFCTPGQVLSAVALLAGCRDPSDAQIKHALGGNLCRCGAYPNIIEAVHRAAAEARDV